jgi:hypothetical protein
MDPQGIQIKAFMNVFMIGYHKDILQLLELSNIIKHTMEIIDNFLSKEHFIQLRTCISSTDFNWIYRPSVLGPVDLRSEEKVEYEKYNFQFVHPFYGENEFTSEHSKILEPTIQRLNPATIIRIKANLSTRSPTRLMQGFHVDHEILLDRMMIAVYYINTNDGKTIFEDGQEVDSVANRMVIFPGDKRHAGTTCTNRKIRTVINFNYISF